MISKFAGTFYPLFPSIHSNNNNNDDNDHNNDNDNGNDNREVVKRFNKKKLVSGVLVGTHSDDKEQRAVTLQQGISMYIYIYI